MIYDADTGYVRRKCDTKHVVLISIGIIFSLSTIILTMWFLLRLTQVFD